MVHQVLCTSDSAKFTQARCAARSSTDIQRCPEADHTTEAKSAGLQALAPERLLLVGCHDETACSAGENASISNSGKLRRCSHQR